MRVTYGKYNQKDLTTLNDEHMKVKLCHCFNSLLSSFIGILILLITFLYIGFSWPIGTPKTTVLILNALFIMGLIYLMLISNDWQEKYEKELKRRWYGDV